MADLTDNAVPGINEELLLGPCAITLLRRCGTSWPATLAIVTAARGAFHVFYG